MGHPPEIQSMVHSAQARLPKSLITVRSMKIAIRKLLRRLVPWRRSNQLRRRSFHQRSAT